MELRVGYEAFEWQTGSVSDLMFCMPSLAFEIRSFGLIPPFAILKDILESGKSDAGLSGYTAWEPITIGAQEYQTIKTSLIEHPVYEMTSDPEIDDFSSDLDEWREKARNKYSVKPYDIEMIDKKLRSRERKGLKKAIEDAGVILYHKRKSPNWPKVKHIGEDSVHSVKSLLVHYVRDDAEFVGEALAALSGEKDLIPLFKECLESFKEKNAERTYWILIYLNRMDAARFPLDVQFMIAQDYATAPVVAEALLARDSAGAK